MKVEDLINKLKVIDKDAEVFYCDENEENGQLIIIENQEKDMKGKISIYYTIEKN